MEFRASPGGYDPSVFAELAALEDGHFWFRARVALIWWAIHKYHADARSMLEIGCGAGGVLAELRRRDPRLRLVGSELFGEGLAQARPRLGPRVHLVQHDARLLPFRSSFDIVGAFDVLEHIADDGAVLRQVRAVLRPGGLLVVTVPQHDWLWSDADVCAQHVRRYTARALHATLADAGFEIIDSTSFVTVLLPLMLASRLAPRRGHRDPLSELRLPRWVNVGLGAVMTLERWLIHCGARFPGGGSLLVVARPLL